MQSVIPQLAIILGDSVDLFSSTKHHFTRLLEIFHLEELVFDWADADKEVLMMSLEFKLFSGLCSTSTHISKASFYYSITSMRTLFTYDYQTAIESKIKS